MRNQQTTKLLFEISRHGRRAHQLPTLSRGSESATSLLPSDQLADDPPPLPELAEADVVRHFVNLSTLNMSGDTHFHPLGSCTMKYTPKRNERMASLAGLVDVHPLQNDQSIPGIMQILFELQQMIGEITGLPGVCLQPAAGGDGELVPLLVAAAYYADRGENDRNVVLTADTAHGISLKSAEIAGPSTRTVLSGGNGLLDIEDLKSKLDDKTAVFMLTNPNTLGLFDSQIQKIVELVHNAGALVYLDGTEMNAILGITRPGDFGADLMQFDPRKIFSGPHGYGGAGPICARDFLADYLPGPIVVHESEKYRCVFPQKSIGRVRSFFGDFGDLARAYIYIRTYGKEGLRQVSEDAVLGANYLLSKVRFILDVPHGDHCMHQFVASATRLKKEKRVSAMDLAKRLLDYGFHAPTVDFPRLVEEAMLLEPSETESKETLDAFAQALFRITEESRELIEDAPHSTKISRPVDVTVARKPILSWDEDHS